jgi:hypothetical protein
MKRQLADPIEDTDLAEANPPTSSRRTPTDSGDLLAWQMIEQGRYMPRRIRGSFRGRELG